MGEFTSYYASGGESEGERERVYDERKDIVDEKQEDQAHDEYSDEPLDSDDPPAPQNTSSGTHTPYNGMSPYDDPKTIHHSPNMRQLHHKLEILRLEQQNDEAAQNPSPPTYGSNTCEATTPVPDEHPIPQPQDELEGYEEISPTCSTSVLCISDTHGGDFKIPPNRVDVLLLSGDILAHAHDNICSQYLSTIDRLNEANAGLKLVIAGNHDAPMDLEYFKDKSRRLPRRQEKKKLVRMLAENHIKYLDEGRYEFTLENGARLKIYVSPFTVKREQSWRAFVYTRHQGHCFDMDEDTDVAMTHGPPLHIRDPHEGEARYRGDESLRHHVAMAKPRLHLFGHHHSGYGITLVDWKSSAADDTSSNATITADWEPKGVPEQEPLRDEQEAGRQDLLTLDGLHKNEALLHEAMENGYIRTSHGPTSEHPIEKDKNTLFVNACYAHCENKKHTQPPIIVDLELPLASAPNGGAIGSASTSTNPAASAHDNHPSTTATTTKRRTTPCCAASRTQQAPSFPSGANPQEDNRLEQSWRPEENGAEKEQPRSSSWSSKSSPSSAFSSHLRQMLMNTSLESSDDTIWKTEPSNMPRSKTWVPPADGLFNGPPHPTTGNPATSGAYRGWHPGPVASNKETPSAATNSTGNSTGTSTGTSNTNSTRTGTSNTNSTRTSTSNTNSPIVWGPSSRRPSPPSNEPPGKPLPWRPGPVVNNNSNTTPTTNNNNDNNSLNNNSSTKSDGTMTYIAPRPASSQHNKPPPREPTRKRNGKYNFHKNNSNHGHRGWDRPE